MFKKFFTRKTTEREQRGQSFMELAISLVFLLILFSAVVDLGWAFYTMTALRDVAQEGASYGAMCSTEAKVLNHLKNSSTEPIDMSLVSDDAIVICYSKPGTNTCKAAAAVARGDMVKITLTYEHQIVTPFVGVFIGNKQSYPLTVDVTDTVLAPNACP